MGSDSKLGRFSGAKAGDTRTLSVFPVEGISMILLCHRSCQPENALYVCHIRILSSGSLGEITLRVRLSGTVHPTPRRGDP